MWLRVSSLGRPWGRNHPPASSPTIFSPARASGSTASPPAAPRPITTTSVLGRLTGAMHQLLCGNPGTRWLSVHCLHLSTDVHSGTGIFDQIPTYKVRVTTIGRVAEHASQRVPANQFEKGRAIAILADSYVLFEFR